MLRTMHSEKETWHCLLPPTPQFLLCWHSHFRTKGVPFLFWFQFDSFFFKFCFFCLAVDSDGSSKNFRTGGKGESTPLSTLLQITAPLHSQVFVEGKYLARRGEKEENIWPAEEKTRKYLVSTTALQRHGNSTVTAKQAHSNHTTNAYQTYINHIANSSFKMLTKHQLQYIDKTLVQTLDKTSASKFFFS